MHSLVSQVERHGVSDEILGTRLKAELGVHALHGILVQVDGCANVSNSQKMQIKQNN